jgi:nucleoside-diphosphate-sugar epimerase
MQKILVTGGAGYIGSVLVRKLLEEKYAVNVIDNLMYGGEPLVSIFNNPQLNFYYGDITKRQDLDDPLKDVYAVIHLAAIVGDPACAQNSTLAANVNNEGARLVFEKAKIHGVKKFIFASTCSNYGKMKDPNSYVTETSELNPISLYAELKVGFEKYLLENATSTICPTILRFATVYGLSPRIRFDLTVNEFAKELILGRTLRVFGEQFVRPYCHVEDIAKAILIVLKAQDEKVNREILNVGDTSENYSKKMIVEEILKQIPEGKIEYVRKTEDPRDYRVNFDKIKKNLGYGITNKVPDGIAEIIKIIRQKVISNPDSPSYKNI